MADFPTWLCPQTGTPAQGRVVGPTGKPYGKRHSPEKQARWRKYHHANKEAINAAQRLRRANRKTAAASGE